MLPEIGGLELLVIAAVALIVVGPKDLPVMLRKLGQFTAKLRGMASEFRASFDEMARQSELDDLRKEVEAMRKGQLSDTAAAFDASNAQVDQVFNEIGNSLQGSDVSFSPAMVSTPQANPVEMSQIVEEAKPKARKAPTKPKSSTAKPTAAPKAATKTATPKKTAKAGAKA
ncbi:Sec-independent protein translocase protein TatB [Phenylobacterium sp.]|uniref:Sec-independent protein translocase protein TatB n=1 Tax=Phenylobacterium sp. TaxID=1871053 RepID=UPI00286D2B3D|nr:Sec-independent protein translocase protein TatB [Phenylobacterium sp.]